jgi:glycosyltransferase involved in cell wall biosynthesis
MTMPPKCSIVIRAYNEEKHIGRLLKGIARQTLPDVETILVDSGSTDRTVDIAESFGVKIVRITPEEFTFGRSLNMGIEAAQAELVVIGIAHCYPVYPDWLEQLVAPLADEQIAISYGKQRGGETNRYSEHQWFRHYFPDASVHRQGHSYCHNANSAIRRSVWQEHQYNENLTGLEDLAWGSWAFEQGHGISYTADAEIIHLHDEGPKTVYNRYRREALAMRQILPHSRFGLWNFLRLAGGKTLSDLMQARREGVLGRYFAEIIWFRVMQYWGTYQGYRYSGDIDAQLHQQFYYPPGILSVKSPAGRGVAPIDYEEVDQV